ncbi:MULTISPECIES: multifunctional oxoglutarate decarboxylase/oxoglutarate dehydrogenase thiamine pyrophosphate-binding subunit/dihydrolipoyllysine-residue succinyltransferase subunit [unclassified Pseudarthrobacter]|uniref:multifunctional oxoglutarate decarboxylase/oxoglutarate dehydrogenase thiamine pyrophosphate-binding subunit/dihydrolipoyllysine-residue succinyltransferase subunit n=1 Tax=unclassified Pseudarthrobacter TaxID=2647000 RepID=UPI0011319A22|nr:MULTISPECIES: multifunctional oxoglutarate decarboxylase/oxoglutarate dehydrogenase thiamine pyrophosphate-binding subunit/dihydrolipoyllysine-residue succinyltransferase subunit [unclassified Pseudarthrobacter]QDG63056.1 multifunctional oxoglutarate decarboxylase/oxoglutarate dehydrogenase thiamine pyrophosphate-binding subunit/dihydrolipoyllysine-residue succinyltransferase subunit [Pseudarthrobacter sp. NIBRBAC000502771]QDG88809.1 multifunctional oxoglutarate decarboxylase/oxoglutarate dehy
MPEQPSHRLPEEFGGNEWLVDELYEQYQQDKNAVDAKWWPLFESFDSGNGSSSNGNSTHAANPPTRELPVVKQAPAAPASSPAAAPAAPAAAAAPAPAAPAAAPAPVKKAPATEARDGGKKTEAGTGSQPIPAQLPKNVKAPTAPEEDVVSVLRGPAKAIATNMVTSLQVPTATSVRAIPAKLLIDNRVVINSNLARARGGKVSFTHLIGYAVIRALSQFPSMNVYYDEVDGKPVAVQPAHVNFGIAIDMPKPDGTRLLMVPNIKKAETLNFAEFWHTYEDLIKRARNGKLTAEDHQGTTVSLTNPGGIGTVHSVPRLSKGQAAIIGVGALDYPAEFQGASEKIIAQNAISKVLTLTSTYDHRVIQGAGSGEFLKLVHQLLLGAQNFYDEIFEALRIPYEPVRWSPDLQVDPADEINKVARIQQLIHSFRVRGHLMADTDPLEYVQRKHPDLDVLTYGLTLWDLDREWPTGGFGGKPMLKFRDILGVLRDAYCRTTGIEYMHIQEPAERKWFQDQLEHAYSKPSREEQLRIVSKLNAAEAFETFLQTKFVGQKRFSLEGGESLIPLLDAILSDAADDGLDEVAIGMAHRGRLNVLTNIAGKTYAQVFREFEGTQDPRSVQGSGDVKYHLGTEGTFTSDNGKETKVYLAANPSHLEAVDSVLEGIVRAKQDRLDQGESFPVLPIMVHGDAAFAGQGVVAETLNLSQLRGYRTGGTIHIVVNNQVGFTTAPSSSRSSTYSTDVAKMIQAPVFHVNGDDPEAVVRIGQLAYEFRQRFHKDVVIDMVCYRRRGHNEGDDPSMTQPLMYNLIEAKRSVRKLYTESLIGRGDITEEEAEQLLRDYQERLERVFAETHAAQTSPIPIVTADSAAVSDIERPKAQQSDSSVSAPASTAISAETLARIGKAHVEIPDGFTVHPKLKQLLDKREQMSREGGIDWGFGEIAAFGSLIMEGVPVRLAGQDSRRGTFVQRHAVFHDRANGKEWLPLGNLSDDQAKLWIYDSLLSEYAAMGFEYGYSVERPDALVLWEAQFGDFVNGAQTIIDEFISSAEQKWGQRSSLVLMLPHGYEGQGPDHSSARIERFLQLCAEDNMIVANPTTAASHFHLLRRQAYSRPRKPLIIFTPKQLLRLKAAASSVEDFTTGTFRPVIGDHEQLPATAVERVLLVSGRLYYDLLSTRQKTGDKTTAIVRVEQLYPLPHAEIEAELAKYPNAEVVWAQDEPANQGPWPFMGLHLPEALDRRVRLVSRPASASTAAGSMKRHAAEQDVLLKQAFARK